MGPFGRGISGDGMKWNHGDEKSEVMWGIQPITHITSSFFFPTNKAKKNKKNKVIKHLVGPFL